MIKYLVYRSDYVCSMRCFFTVIENNRNSMIAEAKFFFSKNNIIKIKILYFSYATNLKGKSTRWQRYLLIVCPSILLNTNLALCSLYTFFLQLLQMHIGISNWQKFHKMFSCLQTNLFSMTLNYYLASLQCRCST